MVDWLVIAADRSHAGRGVSGRTLACFLRTYHGRRAVAMSSPAKMRQEPFVAETLFLGLPTTLEPAEIRQLRCRRLVAFDYLDHHELAWTPDQADAICNRTRCYLKPWREASWNYDLQMGLLPIRRYTRFSVATVIERGARVLPKGLVPKLHDVAFVGRPNLVQLYKNGQVVPLEQRVEWLRELRREASELRLWGGLVGISDNREREQELISKFGDLTPLQHTARKVNFPTYYYHLCRSRVALTPGGNVPWSYRLYEALYSGAVVVSIDFRDREMLVPLPNEGMIHVPDGESVVPAVRQALAWSEERPQLARNNYRHLERFLRWGNYSRTRPELMQRFVAQFA